MIMKCVQLVGPAVGQNGQHSFFRSFKFCQPEQLANEILNGKSQGSIKSSRILQIGQFFFVRTSPADDPCIGELQLLWHDNQSNQSLASVRLYFLPEQTPDGRRHQHGEHEVLAASEKVVLRLEVLGQWITDQVDWTHGLLAPVINSPDSKLAKIENGQSRDSSLNKNEHGQNGLVNGNGQARSSLDSPEANHKQPPNGIYKSELPTVDDDLIQQLDGKDDTESASVVVLSYPHYCRYRALTLRLGNQCDKWLLTSLVEALGGLTVTSRNTRVLFCRDTFDHEGLLNDLNNCDHLAPSVKGKSKKKRLKNFVPAVVPRSQSPGSESNTSEEIKSLLKIPSDLSNEVNNGKKPVICEEEKEFLEKLHKFMQERDTPINRVPHLGFKQIDLYFFYQYAQRLGGYNKVTCNKMWKHIYDEMGGNPGSTSAATCTRRHYERLLLPFENHLNGEDYKTPLPKKHLKRDFDGSNDDLLDEEDEVESLSGEGEVFDQNENTFDVKEEIKIEVPEETLLKVQEVAETISFDEDKDDVVEILEVKPPMEFKETKESLKMFEVKEIKMEKNPERHIEESAGSDDEGNIPLAFLHKVNLTKELVKVEIPITGAPKLEITPIQGGQQDSEVEILEAKEAEDQKSIESLSSHTMGQKKQRVRDNVFSEKERQWNEIRKKNAMARTWVKKGSKSASTSPLPNRHFGPSTIPDQPGDCANCNVDQSKMVCSPMPPQSNHQHPSHLSLYTHHKQSLSKPNSLPPLQSGDIRNSKHHLHCLPPSMNLMESSKPLPIANPPPTSCGYITCGIRNPNCCTSSCGNSNMVPIVKQHLTKANYHHSPVADKNSYQQSSFYPHPAKEHSHSNGRISTGHPRSLSPTNQPRPSVIQHTEKIQSPPPSGGSQPLPAHMSSSKSIPGIHQPNISSRSRNFHPSSQGSSSIGKSRPYDVASLRTSSVSSRSVNSHLKAPDIYAKAETPPSSGPRKEMPSLLPIRALPDCFFQQSTKHSSLIKSLSYAKERAQPANRDNNAYIRRPERPTAVSNNLPGYQKAVQVPTALAPSTPVYLRGNCSKEPESDPCEAEVLDLSVKRKSSSNGQTLQNWPPYEEIVVPEGECLDLSVKKRKIEQSPISSLSDEARGIENVTPPSPCGRITSEPVISERITMLSPLKTPITSLNLNRTVSSEKVQVNSLRRSENRSPPMLIPLSETRTPYALESELIAQHQRQLQRKASEYAAYQQFANGQGSPIYQSNSWSMNHSLIHQPTPHRTSAPLPNDPRSPNENLAVYNEMVERGLLAGQIPYALAPHLYPLMYKEMQHYQTFSK